LGQSTPCRPLENSWSLPTPAGQLPNIVFGSDNLIFVVGAQKITPTLEEANKRLVDYVVPLEDERLMGIYKAHTTFSKALTYHKEGPHSTRKIHVIIVKEPLGF